LFCKIQAIQQSPAHKLLVICSEESSQNKECISCKRHAQTTYQLQVKEKLTQTNIDTLAQIFEAALQKLDAICSQ